MIKYDIKKMAKKPKGVRVKLPKIEERLSSVVSYRTQLRKMLRAMAAEVKITVMQSYKVNYIQDSASWFDRLKFLTAGLVLEADNAAETILSLEAERHTDMFMQTARQALAVDVSAVISNEDLTGIISDASERNASLIKSLSDDTIKRIEQEVYEAKINGKSPSRLSKDLQKQFSIMKNRADLIAQDQMSKFNADLNMTRQTQAGIDSYSWLTSRDERVRSRHKNLDGRVYKWGQATGAENGLPPGKPIRCRCVAIPEITF